MAVHRQPSWTKCCVRDYRRTRHRHRYFRRQIRQYRLMICFGQSLVLLPILLHLRSRLSDSALLSSLLEPAMCDSLFSVNIFSLDNLNHFSK